MRQQAQHRAQGHRKQNRVFMMKRRALLRVYWVCERSMLGNWKNKINIIFILFSISFPPSNRTADILTLWNSHMVLPVWDDISICQLAPHSSPSILSKILFGFKWNRKKKMYKFELNAKQQNYILIGIVGMGGWLEEWERDEISIFTYFPMKNIE